MRIKVILAALLAFFVLPSLIGAEEGTGKATSAKSDTATVEVSDDWLNAVWTQVDDFTKGEEFKMQRTTTVAGVRGAEAEDTILNKLYYKGSRRYPNASELRAAIDKLKEGIARDPNGPAVPQAKYFVAQCYEKLGQKQEAIDTYKGLVKDHPGSEWTERAKKAVEALQAG